MDEDCCRRELIILAVWERTGLYCQMFPHRILFGGIILAYISWGIKHKKTRHVIRLWELS